MEKEACDVELQKDDKYVWKLEVKGDCDEVLKDISDKLGEYGRRYLADRIVFAPREKAQPQADELSSDEN